MTTFVLDAEAVAYDREKDCILPFQVRAKSALLLGAALLLDPVFLAHSTGLNRSFPISSDSSFQVRTGMPGPCVWRRLSECKEWTLVYCAPTLLGQESGQSSVIRSPVVGICLAKALSPLSSLSLPAVSCSPPTCVRY